MLQQCDVAKEQNNLVGNMSQNEANKVDLISTENDENKGDFNGGQVDEKGDLSETE